MENIDTAGWGLGDGPQTEVVVDKSSAFPEEWKEEFEGLLYLGYLEKDITSIPFHRFVVRTLTVNEKLEVSLISKPFLESVGYSRAYKSAVVAAGLVSVDGKNLIPSNKNVNSVRQKYEYVINNWYDTVVDVLYEEIARLEDSVIAVLQEVGILEKPQVENVFVSTETDDDDNPKDGK